MDDMTRRLLDAAKELEKWPELYELVVEYVEIQARFAKKNQPR